jgi:two-component system sensor histidine kinase UhpB
MTMKSEPDNKMNSKNDEMILSGDILIVDDEVPNLKLLTQLLAPEGYRVRPTKRPQLAIDSALAKPPALILLDVKMPEMDGFEVCRRLKQDERTRDIPIIFVSALRDVQDKVRGFEAGGVDFISKPYQEREVLARVRTHLELRSMQLNLEEMVARRTAQVNEQQERFRATFEQAAIGIAHVSPEGKFLRINQKFCDIVGYSCEEMLKLSFQEITHADDLESDFKYVQQVLSREIENYSLEKRYYRKDGSIVWITLTVSLLLDDKGAPAYFIAAVQDISERKQAEEQLHTYKERLRALALELTLTEEQERRQISEELHDGPAQSLSLVRLQLASASETATETAQSRKLDDVSKVVRESIQQIRDVILALGSPSMKEIGLAAAISEWVQDQVEKRYGLRTSFTDTSDELLLSYDTQAMLFRNTRELVMNAAKHAQADSVSVKMESSGRVFRITVEDKGIGFDPASAGNLPGRSGGFGLFSVAERMADLGGALEMVAAPGKGCKATLVVPLEPAEEGDSQ